MWVKYLVPNEVKLQINTLFYLLRGMRGGVSLVVGNGHSQGACVPQRGEIRMLVAWCRKNWSNMKELG